MSSLDLYGKIEPLIPFQDELHSLYQVYQQELTELGVKKVLDVGCGSGGFGKLLTKSGIDVFGIDLSVTMVERARENGIKAQAVDLCDVKENFPCVTAVFDVLNYLEPQDLKKFFRCVGNVLEIGGYFIADINTLFGFEEVAQGDLLLEDEDIFASLSSVFFQEQLETKINLFERKEEIYTREKGKIIQYYHPLERFLDLGCLKLIKTIDLSLFCDESDKTLLLFKKED